MASQVTQLLQALETRGFATSRQIQGDLGLSQPTISRLIRTAGDQVIAIGQGPARRYARSSDLFSKVPIFRVGPTGEAEHLADLRGMRDGGFLVSSHHDEVWLRGQNGDALYDDFPYFLDDLRPQGFLGRVIARSLSPTYPEDPKLWTSAQVLTWLQRRGAHLTGDMVVGEEALNRLRTSARSDVRRDFAELADAAIAGKVAEWPAGGEQPKFIVADGDRQLLVKFSGRGNAPEVTRWRDLLIAEHHALKLLSELGIPAAVSNLSESDGRTFLEVERFDRVGNEGRLPVLSLRAVDAEFTGLGSGWTRTMNRLAELGLVSVDDAARATWLELFGHWIGNNDMHLGNLSLQPTPKGFSLLPVYDMTSMLWAPIRGELPVVDCPRPPIRDPRRESTWRDTAEAARAFWQRVQEDSRLSDDCRKIAHHSEQLIARLGAK